MHAACCISAHTTCAIFFLATAWCALVLTVASFFSCYEFLNCFSKKNMNPQLLPMESIQNLDHEIQDHFVHYSSLICGDFSDLRESFFFLFPPLATRLEGQESMLPKYPKDDSTLCAVFFSYTTCQPTTPQDHMTCIAKRITLHPNKLYVLPSTTLFISPHPPGLHPTLLTHTSLCFLSEKENLIDSYRERDEEPQASSYPFLLLKEQQGGAATPLRSLH